METLQTLAEAVANETSLKNPSGFNSFYYQPERVSISSDSAADNPNIDGDFEQQNFLGLTTFSEFTVKLPRPALNVKSLQLIRASIPNAVQNIPDDECTFWYFRIPAAQVVGLSDPSILFSRTNLHYVRLLPSYYKRELNNNSGLYGFNRTFYDYQDLAAELARSCANDPLQAVNAGFIPNDISITYDQTINKFIFKGNNTFINNDPNQGIQFYYIPAGYLSPAIWEPVGPAPFVPTTAPLLYELSRADDRYGLGVNGQPYKLYKTLNLRLGFTWNGLNNSLTPAGIAFYLPNSLRPPSPNALAFLPNYDINSPQAITYTAENYGQLVFTSCVHVYADITGGSTVDSVGERSQLLAVVPLNASNLGVGFYSPVISTPLTKISSQIYEITIIFRTDNGERFRLPNSAIASLELGLTY